MSVLAVSLLRQLRGQYCHIHRYGERMLRLQVPTRFWGSFSSNDDNDDVDATAARRSGLTQTVTLVQQGVEMHELPMILKKSDGSGISAMCSSTPATNQPSLRGKDDAIQSKSSSLLTDDCAKGYFVEMDDERRELFLTLNECETGEDILQTLTTTPDTIIDGILLEYALERIVSLEGTGKQIAYETQNTVYRNLVMQLCEQADAVGLIRSLSRFHARPHMNWTIERHCDEILQRSADSKLSVINICDAIECFAECDRSDEVEQFWSALASIEHDIDEHNIQSVFGILAKLQVSRRVVLGILERCLAESYPQIGHEDMISILQSLSECKFGHSVSILKSISSWLSIKIYGIDEICLERVVHFLTVLNYSDKEIVKSLEYAMRTEADAILYQPLVVEILKHMRKSRILNRHILNVCSEYVVQNIDDIDPCYFADIVSSFGELYFTPPNTNQFWQAVESYLNKNFDYIKPNGVIDIMLTAAYLHIFPVNFIDRVFNQRFMYPLQLYKTAKPIAKQREKLKLLDAAMTLECPQFHGPFLPRQMVGDRFEFENRVRCILNDNIDVIKIIAGGEKSFTLTTIPNQLPYSALYTIDILFHPAGWNLLLSYNKLRDRNTFVAALIHLPEHYDSSQTYLLGEQQMRVRHLRRIGFKVVSLQYSILAKLCRHRKELHEYYVEQMRKVLPALDPIK